jgi:hypothetical protein
MPVTPTLGRLGQEDHKFKASLGKTLSQKTTGWGCSLVVQCLLSMHKALDSVLSIAKKKDRKKKRKREGSFFKTTQFCYNSLN